MFLLQATGIYSGLLTRQGETIRRGKFALLEVIHLVSGGPGYLPVEQRGKLQTQPFPSAALILSFIELGLYPNFFFLATFPQE